MANQEIRNTKLKYMHGLIESNVNTRDMWKNINSMGFGNTKGQTQQISISLERLNEHFTTPPTNSTGHTTQRQTMEEPQVVDPLKDRFYISYVTHIDVKKALKRNKSKATGSDDISIAMINKLIDIILPTLAHIFNASLTTSIFPKAWKNVFVRPIPQVKTPTTPNDCRPISILPTLSKALERIVHRQLIDYLNRYELLDTCQSGFRTRHSTATALLEVTEDIRKAMDNYTTYKQPPPPQEQHTLTTDNSKHREARRTVSSVVQQTLTKTRYQRQNALTMTMFRLQQTRVSMSKMGVYVVSDVTYPWAVTSVVERWYGPNVSYVGTCSDTNCELVYCSHWLIRIRKSGLLIPLSCTPPFTRTDRLDTATCTHTLLSTEEHFRTDHAYSADNIGYNVICIRAIFRYDDLVNKKKCSHEVPLSIKSFHFNCYSSLNFLAAANITTSTPIRIHSVGNTVKHRKLAVFRVLLHSCEEITAGSRLFVIHPYEASPVDQFADSRYPSHRLKRVQSSSQPSPVIVLSMSSLRFKRVQSSGQASTVIGSIKSSHRLKQVQSSGQSSQAIVSSEYSHPVIQVQPMSQVSPAIVSSEYSHRVNQVQPSSQASTVIGSIKSSHSLKRVQSSGQSSPAIVSIKTINFFNYYIGCFKIELEKFKLIANLMDDRFTRIRTIATYEEKWVHHSNPDISKQSPCQCRCWAKSVRPLSNGPRFESRTEQPDYGFSVDFHSYVGKYQSGIFIATVHFPSSSL
ncbi:hypothetical protein ANN_15559 [Periplaneta americana]|uniref:Reverse transcriptase domain-containing protein n=1 Tax=Periplaneta americana TaxID=6978 RepID=A0ABQ8SGP6_PERAM|nr:hypothetical protein ANN_15559 [Periplaneta americana]